MPLENKPKQELLTVTKAGTPVSDRIATVEAARDIYKRLVEANLGDAERRFRIKGQIDGRPPYDPDKLKEMGLGYITNVNFLELRATIDDRAGRRFSSYYEVPQLVNVKMTTAVDPASDAPDYGTVVAEEFTRLLKEDWDGFYPLMDLVGRESDSYGLGVAMFPDEFDWRPEERHVSNFFPDPNAKVDLSKLSMFSYNGTFKVGELFRTISDPSAAASAGWNVPAVRALLVRLFVKKERPGDLSGGPLHGNAWEELEQRYRNNDFAIQIDELRDVDVAHIVYAQVDTGEIGHKILSRSEDPVDKFLFEAPRRFKKMQNVLWCLPYNYGDGYVRSCRGIASYIEQHSDLSNRYLGSAFDAGRTASTLLVQPTGPADYDRLTVVRQGILTVVDHRLKIQQSSFQPRINDLIALRRVSSELMQNNTRETKDMPEDPSYNPQPKTAEEVREVAARSNRGENSQAVFYAIQLQKLYREMFRRLTNPDYILSDFNYPGSDLAILFARRCVERGVPLEMLLDIGAWRIQAVKPVGGGSPQARASADQAMMQIRNEADEKGRREIIRSFAAGQVGYDNVDRYFPAKTRDSIETNEHSIAALETSDFYSGSQGVVGSDQNHVIHFTVHAQPVQQISQAVEEQGPEAVDPQRAVTLLSAALPHIESHLRLLQREPTRKQFVQQGVALLKQGIKTLDVLQKLLEKMQAEQEKLAAEKDGQLADAQAKAFSADQQLELAKATMKQEVEVLRQQSLNAMRASKTAEQMRINAERVANDSRLKSEKQAVDIELARQKAEADVEVKRTKAGTGDGK